MEFYFNPLDTLCKSVTGGVLENTPLKFCVFAKDYSGKCFLVLRPDNNPAEPHPVSSAAALLKERGIFRYEMQLRGGVFTAEIITPGKGLYWYYFETDNAFISADELGFGVMSGKISFFQLTVYKNFKTPDFIKGKIMYQILPDRFFKEDNNGQNIGGRPAGKALRADWGGTPYYLPNDKGKILNNDFFGGNFKGIQKKLGYLKSLSVGVIYLNPIFKAASNHRYDIGDYMTTDELLGSEEDFKKLIAAADTAGIKIILDGVFNHSGDDSVYFNKYNNYDSVGAYNSKESPYFNWYIFNSYPDDYKCWWGVKILPKLNENDESFVNFITGGNGVIEKWISTGAYGFRIDVADELSDEFLQKIRSKLKAVNGEAVIIGEVWEDASNKISYGKRKKYLQGEELDSVMNYPLKDAVINFIRTKDTLLLIKTINAQLNNYPHSVLHCLMNILGTHDTARILTVLGRGGEIPQSKSARAKVSLTEAEYREGVGGVKTAALILYTVYGVPCVYYGDERGMQGFEDPFNRRCIDWDENNSLTDYFILLGKMRAGNAVFKDGDFKILFCNQNVIIYQRAQGEKIAVTGVNFSQYDYNINFNGKMKECLSGKAYKNVYTLKKNGRCLLSNR